MKNLGFFPHAVKEWTSLEVSPVRKLEGDNAGWDVCPEEFAEFYSLYIRMTDGFARCVADLPTKQQAEDLKLLIEQMVKKLPKV